MRDSFIYSVTWTSNGNRKKKIFKDLGVAADFCVIDLNKVAASDVRLWIAVSPGKILSANPIKWKEIIIPLFC